MKINYCKKKELSPVEKNERETLLLVVGLVVLLPLICICVSACHTNFINEKYKVYIKHPAAIEYMDRKWSDGNTGWYHLNDNSISVKKSLIDYIDSIKARQKEAQND